MEALTGLALSLPAGLNPYIPLLMAGVAVRFGWLELVKPYDMLGEWWALAIVAVLLVVEIVADKVPAVDHVNDAIGTVVRPAVGGFLALAAGSSTNIHPVLLFVAGVIMAGGAHAAKATARPVVNVSTGGAGAPLASTIEDVAAFFMSVLAIVVPVIAVALGAVVAFVGVSWMRRKLAARKEP